MAQDSLLIELSLPRTLRCDESIEIQITTEPLPQGARLLAKTEQGEILGAVTPFGFPGSGSTATIPVPKTALVDGRLRLHLQIVEPDVPPRPPPADSVKVELVIVRGP